jgi:hypothetical protein
MRGFVTASDIALFMGVVGASGTTSRVYFTGGACAVLLGWRDTAIDIDIKIVPADDRVLRARPDMNVDLACPADFIPPLPGWEERSIPIEGPFHHYDLYAQCLAKIERGHHKDRADVAAMLERGLVQRERLQEFFEAIEPELYRYPAIDPPTFRAAVAQLQ